MKPVTIYTTKVCPYCIQAKTLLAQLNVTNLEEIRVDTDPSKREEMMQKTNLRTVPQIFIGDTHIGGFSDIQKLHQEGKLRDFLSG